MVNRSQIISIAKQICTTQSPININPNHVSVRHIALTVISGNLGNVLFSQLYCVLEDGIVEVAGGGLSHLYTANVIHFHWGGDMWHPGSEHTVESQRFWAEHVILPINTFIGFQVSENSMHAEAWRHLTSYLLNVTQKGKEQSRPLSISDLLDVDLTKFYRYHGSLTTPACEEVVVWTIFKEPIKIQRELVSDQRFPKTLKYGNTYRMVQKLNGRPVYGSQGMSVSPEGHVGNGYTFSSGALPSGLIPLSSLVMLGWE
uniref:Alpha-carbonic anhydrase domain-containing protein n=1 Tax=Esox lucius TaxID=8010 RepID=A0A6Q2ZHS5_ESOLU